MRHYLIAIMLLTVALPTTQAEDIEIYQGQAVGVRQNAVFAIDTSRSMSYWEEQDIGEFDPTREYPKPINGFHPDRYYYSVLLNGNGSTDTEITEMKKRYFHPDALVCSTAKETLDKFGVMHAKFKRWDPTQNNWETPLSDLDWGLDLGTLRTDAYIECRIDENKHPVGEYIDTRGRSSSKMHVPFVPWNYSSSWLSSINHIYTGNYLNYQIFAGDWLNETSKMSRMAMTRSAVNEVVNTINGVRLGLMRFSSDSAGGFVDVPVDDIENVRTKFVDQVNSYFTWGGTPLGETYHEAALYMRGDYMRYGNNSESVIPKSDTSFIDRDTFSGIVNYYINLPFLKTIDTKSAPLSRVGGSSNRYQSPITNSCQSSSSIILFTDGAPSGDTASISSIKKMIKDVDFKAGSGLSHNCSGNGGCSAELAYYLNNYDQRLDLPGKQTIRTFVVGGFFDRTNTDSSAGIKLMEAIAHHGGTEKVLYANSRTELVTALNKAIGSVADTPATFVAPAISANSYNSLEHLDELYYAMFAPSGGAEWKGNLKTYRLTANGTIVDAEGDPAVNPNGTFEKKSRSYWTPESTSDGENIHLGGASNLLTAKHKIFTHLSTTTDTNLSDTLTTNNISKALLGLAENTSAEEHQAVIDWGNRVSTAASDGTRREMEDPLHSRPVVINYSVKQDETGKLVTDSLVFVATNSGYLHAFKADKHSFKEYFSFIPKELLKNLAQYKESATQEKKIYGLDGAISYWHQDKNRDNIVDSGEKLLLFVGMRRGGRNYYAIDISDRYKPKFAWQITGGIDDFENLGQSWSEMTLAKVPWKGSHKVVLLFGGGYDPIEDDRTSQGSHGMGNSIYMVDAETGELLWQASNKSADFKHRDMTTSIVSDIRPVDVDGDSIMDYFYNSDVGGKVWRFDIDPDNEGARDFAKGGVLFNANENSDTGYQRFFNSPSVAYFVRDGERFLTLSIGSGFRAHPLQDTASDSFYIIKDYNVIEQPVSYDTATPGLLATIGEKATDAEIHRGWKFIMPGNAEKVLANALTTNDTVYFTAFAPSADATNPGSCLAGVGTAKAYSIAIPHDPEEELKEVVHPIETTIIPPPPIEILTNKRGDIDFCKSNPGHDSCAGEGGSPPCDGSHCEPPPDVCEKTGSVILSGTESIGNGTTRCGLLRKNYWLEAPRN